MQNGTSHFLEPKKQDQLKLVCNKYLIHRHSLQITNQNICENYLFLYPKCLIRNKKQLYKKAKSRLAKFLLRFLIKDTACISIKSRITFFDSQIGRYVYQFKFFFIKYASVEIFTRDQEYLQWEKAGFSNTSECFDCAICCFQAQIAQRLRLQ